MAFGSIDDVTAAEGVNHLAPLPSRTEGLTLQSLPLPMDPHPLVLPHCRSLRLQLQLPLRPLLSQSWKGRASQRWENTSWNMLPLIATPRVSWVAHEIASLPVVIVYTINKSMTR